MTPLNLSPRRQGQLHAAKALWSNVLAIPLPSDQQFMYWICSFGPSAVSEGILQAAKKNLRLGGSMDQTHAIKFASVVMNTNSRTKPKQQALPSVAPRNVPTQCNALSFNVIPQEKH
jgi:hypothetical protein